MGLRGELTESQKVAVRQKLILEQLGDANGDLARTSGSLANKWRALKGRVEELATNLGRGLVPVAQDAVKWLDGKLSPVTTRLTDHTEDLRSAVSDLAGGKGYGALAHVLDVILGGHGKVEDAVNRLGDRITRIVQLGKDLRDGWRAGGLDGLVGAFDTAVGAGGRLRAIVRKVVNVGRDLLTIWRDGVTPGLEALGPVVGVILSPLSHLDSVTHALADHAGALAPIVTTLAAGWAAYKVAAAAAKGIQVLSTAATIAQAAATGGLAAATGAAEAAEWGFVASLLANPIVLIVAGVAALVVGLWQLYKHSKTVRDVIHALGVVGKAAIGWVVDKVVDLWHATQPVHRLFLWLAAFTFAPLVAAIALVVTHWHQVTHAARRAWELLKAVGSVAMAPLRSALKWIGDKLRTLVGWAKKLGGWLSKAGGWVGKGLHAVGIGDTPRPHAGGRIARRSSAAHNLGHTLAVHRAIDGRLGGRRTVTSTVRNVALGSGNSDHVTGRALDVTGSNLNGYARHVRAAGGFAEFHGSGSGRHLHAAIGDTPRPRASSSSSDAAGDVIIIQPGAIIVDRPASTVELDRAVASGIRRYVRERRERK